MWIASSVTTLYLAAHLNQRQKGLETGNIAIDTQNKVMYLGVCSFLFNF